MLRDELKNIKSSKPELKKFGITLGIFLLVLGMILYYYGKSSSYYFAPAGALLLLLGLIYPSVLKPLQRIWMGFAVILGFIMTRLILSVLYYLILTLTGLLAKLFGKDFLNLHIEKMKKSYWDYRESKEYTKLDSERQF